MTPPTRRGQYFVKNEKIGVLSKKFWNSFLNFDFHFLPSPVQLYCILYCTGKYGIVQVLVVCTGFLQNIPPCRHMESHRAERGRGAQGDGGLRGDGGAAEQTAHVIVIRH